MIIDAYISEVNHLYDRERGTMHMVTLQEKKRFGQRHNFLLTEEEYKELDPKCRHCGHFDNTMTVKITLTKESK